MHNRGYAHLDVSPNNVWIPCEADRPAYLLDLGSSTPIGEKRSVISGTIGYYPTFENLTIASKAINNYGYEKLLELKPDMKTSEAAGGAGKGSSLSPSLSNKRKRTRSKKSRKTRRRN